ncbi:AraC family transcriptional regulator [Paenibacillus sp. 19GGS1-52]|uniref:AraC family transcriptional regulator n=1 Tax=Paenibacillus sp. 19GGS1-52 TaxID=2758563 RepID=UPI001EFC15A3|nr:helix-turn-helix domain-containing protein [Paenibacillus sp. 19GGS1-52]ULO06171.1 AraC family transcriptional regulator [Paenibacillus sp. 19GGS1-52]
MVTLEGQEGRQYICKLIYEAYQIPVFMLDSGRRIVHQLPLSLEGRPLTPDFGEMLKEITDPINSAGPPDPAAVAASVLPFIRSTQSLENFIILPLPSEPQAAETIVIGPSLYEPLTESNAANLLRDNNIPLGLQEEWLHYYRNLTVLTRTRLYHAAMLLYTLVTGQTLTITELLLDARTSEPKQKQPVGSPDLNVSFRRENIWLHHEPMQEQDLFRHIQNGNKAELLRTHATFSEEKYGLLSKKSHLRSKKNLAVASITLATRAAIAGGLFWEIAYTLSDFHIQHIEELRDVPAVDNAVLDALCDFADQVRDNRKSKLSRTAAVCQNYIFNHLYEELSLDKLAEVAGLNGSYLSQLFKKETGIAISDYIQRERIEEAKRLMEYSGITLSDIATRLHFNDQSYFTKVFKKYTGTTPRQFRN